MKSRSTESYVHSLFLHTYVYTLVVFVTAPALSSALAGHAEIDLPIVGTKTGSVAGVRLQYMNQKVEAFFRIPFAEPPVGDLRFKKPLSAKPWDRTLFASDYGPGCVQDNYLLGKRVIYNNSATSEDCLHLNVLRPTCISKGTCRSLPVVILIYGGAFQWGDASIYYNDGLVFAAVNDVIVVSFNYRVGAFGFLSAHTKDAQGNLGFYDQLLAMKWVQANIHFFGGNPKEVTLFGQSAGAFSVGLHVLSPLSKGLFKRCIFESGTPLSLITFQMKDELSRFNTLVGLMNCSDPSGNVSTMLRCLRQAHAHDIRKEVSTLGLLNDMFIPVYGDEFIPHDPLSPDSIKTINGEEMFMGTTLNEGSLFMYYPYETRADDIHYAKDIYDILPSVVISGLFDVPAPVIRKYIHSYFENGVEDLEDTEILNLLAHSYGDPVFVCPTNFWGQFLSGRGHDVYRYVYAHKSELQLWDDWLGVVHTDDVPYMLGSLATVSRNMNKTSLQYLPAKIRNFSPSSEDLAFSMQLVRTLGDFVKTGKPKIPDTDQDWPKYSEKSPDFIYLQPHNFTKGIGPKLDRCELWKPYLLRQKTTANTTPKPKPTPRRKPTHSRKPPKQQMDDNTIAGGSVSFGDSTILLTTLAILAKLTL